mmetsp:Transcript_88049/g.139094  ORF Transcript_88049/g.139094 Transcript_88049/m.139094 type:complete len:872 (+) Transcript_88049:74-2689(+)
MSLAEDRRRLAQDKKALFELRQRLFAQGLGLLAESDSTSQEAGSEALPSVCASIESVTHAVAAEWQKTPPSASSSNLRVGEEDDAEEDAGALIRRRLFAQYPSHNPLDATTSTLSDGIAESNASFECADHEREGVCQTNVDPSGSCLWDDSMESTIGPCSPDEKIPFSTRPSGSGCSPLPRYRGEPPSAEWTSGNNSSLFAEDGDAAGQLTDDMSPPTLEASDPPLPAFEDSSEQAHADVQVEPIRLESIATDVEQPKQCEIVIEDVELINDFERVNDSLRRHGFGSIAHRLETAEPAAYSAEPRSRLVADGRGLWASCADVLSAYEARGKRLQDALLAERSEDRRSRDTRVKELLLENKRLEGELRKSRETPPMQSPSSAQSTRFPQVDKELADLALKVKAAEALARHREREMEQLRIRLDQAIGEDMRRQEREREALAKPLRRRGAARDDPLLVVAVAHQARAEALQADLASLTKHSHTLSFQLDAAEEKCRKLQAQQQFQMLEHTMPSGADDSQSQREDELLHLREVAGREAELRIRIEEQFQAQMMSHANSMQAIENRLIEAESRATQMDLQRREAAQQPSGGELRWQGEALRLRDELAKARRAWRSADPRVLMRRDKDIRSLGLDPRALENEMKKEDLVAILTDVCLQLRVGDLSQVLPRTGDLAKLDVFYTGVQDVLQELGEAAFGDDGTGTRDGTALLAILRNLALELRRLRHDESSRSAAAEKEVAERAQGLHVAEEGFRALAAELRLPQDAMPSACLQRVTELRITEATLEGLAAQLRCKNPKELPQQVESLLRICDERLAAQRIVEALQKLLRAGGVDEVLPALKEVLDIGALRRRAVARSDGGGCRHIVPSGGRELRVDS